jgi:hypothetical protein
MNLNILEYLGPLKALAGTWEGEKGEDKAPSDDRGTEENRYKERLVFEPFGPTINHEQVLYGLRYNTTAWRLGEQDPFHEELGYWLWDAKEKQVMRCFMVPRGVTVIAGGTVEPSAKEFALEASVGSDTYGILSNRFLEREFKTVKYLLKISILTSDTFRYEEDTQLQLKNRKDIFHHTDSNTIRRIK